MTVAVRGRVPRKWNDQTVRHITERLQTLERAIAGGQEVFTGPGAPPFGPGAQGPPGTPGASGPPGTPGVENHGELIGLEDDDHPQYVLHDEQARPQPHVHGEHDIPNLESRFPERGENVRPEPHTHAATDIVGLTEDPPQPPDPHQHVLGDVADFGQWEMTLWRRLLNGPYGG